MIEVDFNNQTRCRIDETLVMQVVKATLKEAAAELIGQKKISVSVAAVSGKEIARLNAVYRKKDKTTDVLSFSTYKNEAAIRSSEEKVLYLGELILGCEYIGKSATMNKVSFERELAYVISHGMLHLLGWRHGKPMFAVQDKIAEQYD